MRSAALCAIVVVLAAADAAANRAGAQDWNDPRALALVRRATDRRAQQLADSGLVDYRATAHGYLTFLAQLGDGFLELPRVVKADELALQVYWRAPNLSKQRVVGRRDTTLLPTDIAYHRDHLGIVQNNFPAIIRIGEGDEVRDVPHPLSRTGLNQYDFALTDSLRITMPGRIIDVYEVKVRPFDDEQPRVLGAIYLDRQSAQVVRMAFSFTRAAYVDKQLESVFIVLENGLVEQRFWLPRRQEIEIRRTASWLDYPVRGMIRGRWEIGDYAVNVDTPAPQFTGPEIVIAPPVELRAYQWPEGKLLDSLPAESRLPTPTEIRRVQEEARAIVRAQTLGRPRGLLAARGASDLIRFDRNAGLSLGAGFTARLGSDLSLTARGRHGIGDQRGRGTIQAAWLTPYGVRLAVFAMDDVRDAGDVAERSTLVNSLTAQEFGNDYSDLYGVHGWGVSASAAWLATRWTGSWSWETSRDLGRNAAAFSGDFAPSFDADGHDGHTFTLRAERPTRTAFGFDWRGGLEGRVWNRPAVTCEWASGAPVCHKDANVARGALTLDVERDVGALRASSRTIAAATSGTHFVRAQDLVYFGGPVSAPGYAFHELVGDRALSHTVAVELPVPFVGLGLGRFGRLPARALLTPHWTSVLLRRNPQPIARGSLFTPVDDPLTAHPSGWYHSAGVSLTVLSDLLRFDASRPIDGGRWRFSVDVTRGFWGIL